jgi:transposase
MGKCFRSADVNQALLLPPCLHDWLPEKHLARFVVDVVDALDLGAIYESYEEKDGRGQAAYDPTMMVRVLLYGYCIGCYSSRKIQAKTYEDIAFRYLAADEHPDHSTLAEFRRRHLEALAGLFSQAIQLCEKAGLVKLGHVAIDGSKIQGNASKHKAMSYERMRQQEKAIREQVKELLARAEAIDAAEDASYGKDRRGDELPEELRRRESRLERIREAKKAVEQRAREKAEGEGKAGEGTQPKGKDQYNFTDPDSRIMPSSEGFVQAYNAQVVVEPNFQWIVGQAVTQATNDKQQVQPMVEATEQQSGQRPEELLADSGYCSEKNLEHLDAAGELDKPIAAYIATERHKHGQEVEACPRGRLPKGANRVERMRRKLKTKAGAAIYATRKTIVEPVFGQIKEARGFRRFSLRGLVKVQAEWAFVCLTHNISKLYRLCYQ